MAKCRMKQTYDAYKITDHWFSDPSSIPDRLKDAISLQHSKRYVFVIGETIPYSVSDVILATDGQVKGYFNRSFYELYEWIDGE